MYYIQNYILPIYFDAILLNVFNNFICRIRRYRPKQTSQDTIAHPMPSKDVKINGQVKYAVRESVSLKNVFAHISGSFVRKLPENENSSSKTDILYASCFSDGVYRYPANFQVAGNTKTEKSNIVKLVLNKTDGKYFSLKIFK